MYAFTNHFSQSCLRERVGMMNRRRSGWAVWGRYASLALITVSVAFACQFVRSGPSHRYIEQCGDDFYGLITAQTSDRDLDSACCRYTERAKTGPSHRRIGWFVSGPIAYSGGGVALRQ